MNQDNVISNIARRQFDMIDDWKIDHDSAMNCYELEEMIETGSFLYARLQRAYEVTCRQLYRGMDREPVSLAEDCCKLHSAWLTSAVEFVPFLASYEAEFGSVRGADEFRVQVARVQQLLQNWTVPTSSSTPGVLAWEVSPDEAAQLHELVKAQPGSPGTQSRELRPMPAGDSSLIR